MLIGKNISLRSPAISDAKFINTWRNKLSNKILTQGYRLPTSNEKDESWLMSKITSYNNNEIYFIIEESEKPIGLIQLINIDYISGTANWGFIIGDENSRGKGYSVEAPLLLLNYAFNVLNLRKISSYNLDFNIATLKMHKKIGIVHNEGCLKEHYYFNNKYWDVHILTFFKDDFLDLKLEV